jgi:hypothetical protein
MQYPEWAKLGQVTEFIENEWTADIIPDYAAIICRNNAPLFKLAFALIRAGRGVSIVGADIGPSLVKALKKLGPEHLNGEQAYEAIDRWEKEKLAKAKGKATIKDKAECLRVFVDIGGSLWQGQLLMPNQSSKLQEAYSYYLAISPKASSGTTSFILTLAESPRRTRKTSSRSTTSATSSRPAPKSRLTLIDMDLYRRKS